MMNFYYLIKPCVWDNRVIEQLINEAEYLMKIYGDRGG